MDISFKTMRRHCRKNHLLVDEASRYVCTSKVCPAWVFKLHFAVKRINSQSLEDMQVGYISQKYSFDKYTLGRAFKPSYALLSI